MTVLAMSDKTAIAGVGWTEFTRNSGTSVSVLAARASLMAIEDAGLAVDDIDGVVSYFHKKNDSIHPRDLAEMMGLTASNFHYFHDGGGSWNAAAVLAASMMVHSGMCTNVLVYNARNRYSEGRKRRAADAFDTAGPDQFDAPFGSHHAAANFGQYATAHMAEYGVTLLDFAHLAVTQRKHATLNKKAMMRSPISIEDHQNSRWIIYPFRLLDCCQENDGAIALVVTSAERARDLRHNPVYVMGGSCGHEFGRDDGVRETALRTFESAGITPADVDIAEIYDNFTFMCLKHLADFNLVPGGDIGAWVREGNIGLDGAMPLNTHGGLLSEAHFMGFNHVVEAVQQLRAGGVADDFCEGPHTYDRTICRQVRDPEIAFVCGNLSGSAVVLRKG
jgi:acetyl-CoA acetyltransferase